MRTGGGVTRGPRPSWVDLGLRLAHANLSVDLYREMMEDIQYQEGQPYRDRRYRNQIRRDRRLYRQLRREQVIRDVLTDRGLYRSLPAELVQQIQFLRRADENRYMNRITNRRQAP